MNVLRALSTKIRTSVTSFFNILIVSLIILAVALVLALNAIKTVIKNGNL